MENVGNVPSLKSPENSQQIILSKRASEQQKAVVGKILEGVQESPRPLPDGIGNSVNIAA